MQTNLVVIPADQLRQLITDVVRSELQQLPAAPEPETLPELMTKKETAAYLSVSLSTIESYTRDGLLTKMKIGPSAVRFARDEVRNLARTLPMQ